MHLDFEIRVASHRLLRVTGKMVRKDEILFVSAVPKSFDFGVVHIWGWRKESASFQSLVAASCNRDDGG